jgi:hypothetical protein
VVGVGGFLDEDPYLRTGLLLFFVHPLHFCSLFLGLEILLLGLLRFPFRVVLEEIMTTRLQEGLLQPQLVLLGERLPLPDDLVDDLGLTQPRVLLLVLVVQPSGVLTVHLREETRHLPLGGLL